MASPKLQIPAGGEAMRTRADRTPDVPEIEKASARKVVPRDVARLTEGATEVACSASGDGSV